MIRPVVRSVVSNVVNSLGGSAFNWAGYWKSQSEVLFFGEITKITNEKLYNQKVGSTDFLTVGGAVGSYTFQCPNTAQYIAADTDYVWFKTDGVQRTITEVEMVGYDFTRTIVKYKDTSPYSIECIMILSSPVITLIENKMRDDFHLSVWWNNVLSIHGVLKGNRGTGQSIWIPKANDLFIKMIALGEPPDMSRRLVIQKAFLSLIANNLDTKLDAIWTPAAHGSLSYRLDWLNNYNLADGIAPIFTIDEGITGDAATMYLKTGINPSLGGFNYIKNSASFGFYSRTSGQGAGIEMGAYTVRASIKARTTADKIDGYINVNTIQQVVNTDGSGFFAAIRESSTTQAVYKNKIRTAASITATGLPTEMGLLAILNNGTPALFSEKQIAFAFMGSGLTSTEVELLYDIMISGYLNDIGAKL